MVYHFVIVWQPAERPFSGPNTHHPRRHSHLVTKVKFRFPANCVPWILVSCQITAPFRYTNSNIYSYGRKVRTCNFLLLPSLVSNYREHRDTRSGYCSTQRDCIAPSQQHSRCSFIICVFILPVFLNKHSVCSQRNERLHHFCMFLKDWSEKSSKNNGFHVSRLGSVYSCILVCCWCSIPNKHLILTTVDFIIELFSLSLSRFCTDFIYSVHAACCCVLPNYILIFLAIKCSCGKMLTNIKQTGQ